MGLRGATLVLLACQQHVAGEAVTLTGKNFEKKVLKSKKSSFVKFLAPW